MKALRPLLNRTPLLPGESLSSLIWRLQAANYYESKTQIADICADQTGEADSLSSPTKGATFEALANLTQIPVLDLYYASVHRFALTLTPPTQDIIPITLPTGETVPLLTDNLIRENLWIEIDGLYCPRCLAESAHHRLEWLPIATAACLRHTCLLVRRCSSCRAPVNIPALLEDMCAKCGFILSQAPVTELGSDVFGLLTQRTIQSWWGTMLSTFPVHGLPNHPISTLYRLMAGLAQAIKRTKQFDWLHQPPFEMPLPLTNNKTFLTPAQTYPVYVTAFRAMMNWPDGFSDLLDTLRRDRGNRSSELVQEDFGIIYNWLERNWRHWAFQFVQDAFDQYLSRHYTLSPSVIRLRRFREHPTFKGLIPYITQTEAARELGVLPETVKGLVEQGFLVSYEQAEQSAPAPYFNLIRREEIIALRDKWQQSRSLEDTARFLGFSHEIIWDLIQINVLEAVRGPTIDRSPIWRLSKSSVHTFRENLRLAAAREPFAPTVDLIKATQALSNYGCNMAVVLKYILDGQLKAFGRGYQFNKLAVSVEDLEALRSQIRSNLLLVTRQQVAQMMKVKISTVTAWMNSGLLTPVEQQNDAIYFEHEAVQAFVADYIFAEEAAEILGVGLDVVQKWARKGRLKAAVGGSQDECHRYLFRREEVERLKPENRLTTPQLARQLGISRSQLWVWIQQGKVRPVSGPGVDGSKHYLFERPEKLLAEPRI